MPASSETIRLLADRIREFESPSRPCLGMPLGAGGLGELFPENRLTAGSLVELLPRVPGAGTWTIALLLARHACGERKTLLIADREQCFYPPAAWQLGIDPGRTVIVRTRDSRLALLALGQALRCPAIGSVIGSLERLSDRDGRRLQLAAEAGGAVGVLLRPAVALNTPSFAAVRLLVSPLPSSHGRRRVQLEVVRCRGGQEGKTLCAEIDDATGHVRAFSPASTRMPVRVAQ